MFSDNGMTGNCLWTDNEKSKESYQRNVQKLGQYEKYDIRVYAMDELVLVVQFLPHDLVWVWS